MYLIRNEQMALLRRERMDAMVARAHTHVRQFYPKAVAGMAPVQLERLLRVALDTGRACGFVTVAEALKFVNLTIELGGGFERRAPYAAITQAPITASDKFLHVRLHMARQAEIAE